MTRRAVAPDTERTWTAGTVAFAVGVAFVAFGGVRGLAGAVLFVGAWYLLGTTYAFAVGNVAVVGLLGDAGLLVVAGVEVGLLVVLLSPALTLDDRTGPVLVLFGVLALGGATAWATAQSLVGLPAAAVGLTATVWLVAYGLHRWQLVGLGLVDEADHSGERTIEANETKGETANTKAENSETNVNQGGTDVQ